MNATYCQALPMAVFRQLPPRPPPYRRRQWQWRVGISRQQSPTATCIPTPRTMREHHRAGAPPPSAPRPESYWRMS